MNTLIVINYETKVTVILFKVFVNGKIVIHIFGTRNPTEKFILGKISSDQAVFDQARNLRHYFIEDNMNLYLYEERKVIKQSCSIRTLCEQH